MVTDKGRKQNRIFLAGALVVFALLLASCSTTVSKPGIPANEFKPPEIYEQRREDAIKMREEVAQLSQVHENNVFKTVDGVPMYKVGPADLLRIVFYERSKPIETLVQVQPDGTISYSFIEDLNVQGFSTREVDDALTQRLKRYVKDVRLDVFVKEFNSKQALLFGEIFIRAVAATTTGPGQYELEGKTSILDLIVKAGGYIPESSDLKSVSVLRGDDKFVVNLYDVIFKGDVSQNIIIEDGDVVTVPELPNYGERVYVFGEVQQVGVYPHKSCRDLLAAVANAGGFTRTAVEAETKIVRGYNRLKDPVVITADLKKLFHDGDVSQNVDLEDGDLVFVPRSVIGDINEWLANTVPLLDYLFYPGQFRDYYSDTNFMRLK